MIWDTVQKSFGIMFMVLLMVFVDFFDMDKRYKNLHFSFSIIIAYNTHNLFNSFIQIGI